MKQKEEIIAIENEIGVEKLEAEEMKSIAGGMNMTFMALQQSTQNGGG